MSCAWESKYDGQQQSKAMLDISAAGAVKEAVNPLMAKIVAMDEKVEKVRNFMLKGPESVFKDIAIFAKEMLKCPICLAPPKDEMCSSRKYPYPPHGRLMEIPGGRRVSKVKFFE